jgi:multiple antibiotic resistance protein
VSAWEILAALGRSYLFVLAALLPILNPPATAPIFLSMTEGASASTRRLLARRIARNTVLLLMGSMLVGSYVLDFFGISLPIVRVGGGLIVATAAWRLLSPGQQPLDQGSGIAKAFTAEQASRQAFYPLTFPITCGPGSISTAITVGVTLPHPRMALSLASLCGGVLALVSTGMLIYLAFRYAQQLLRPLGEAGMVVFLRLSAFILLCLGVQIVWAGASELLVEVMTRAEQISR